MAPPAPTAENAIALETWTTSISSWTYWQWATLVNFISRAVAVAAHRLAVLSHTTWVGNPPTSPYVAGWLVGGA